MEKRFIVYLRTKEEFIAEGLPTKYYDSFVFIQGDANGNGACIYTRGRYYANFPDLLSKVNYVKGINVGGTSYNVVEGGGYIAFNAKDPATVSVNVGSNGIEVGLTENFINSISEAINTIETVEQDLSKRNVTAVDIGEVVDDIVFEYATKEYVDDAISNAIIDAINNNY